MTGRNSLGEFDLIARYLAPLSAAAPGAYGLQDDAASIAVAPGHELVVTTDAMIEGVHFLSSDGPARIARKLLRVNLSDLAAKGATPVGYQLVLGLPGLPDEGWLGAFTSGLAMDQAAFACPLLGGDTVRSPGGLVLSVTAFGSVPAGQMLLRSGAKSGDNLYVTGSVGDAALGLEVKLNHRLFSAAAMMFFDSRLHLPTPRLGFGQKLRGIANAALDISDGLVQDVGHMASASGLKARIFADRLPLATATQAVIAEDPSLLSAILTGGDDYEIAFAAPPEAGEVIQRLSASLALNASRIGQFESGSGVEVLDGSGNSIDLPVAGFQHFGPRAE
jgi:thiamine-monophosphate kinase